MQAKILAVVAHPADAIDMIGGTMAIHTDRGDKVVTAIMNTSHYTVAARLSDEIASGTAKGDRTTIEAAGKAFEKETQEAFKIMGAGEVRFVQPYGEIMLVNADTIDRIASLLQELRPHIVVTHHPLEDGLAFDHSAVGRMVIQATYVAAGARENGLPAHHVGQVFFFTPPGETTSIDNHANRFPQIMIDVTDYVERKVRAMALLAAKYYDDISLAAKIVEAASSTQAASHQRVSYAETFLAYKPQVHKCLPITEHAIEKAQNGWKHGLDKLRFVAPYLKGVTK